MVSIIHKAQVGASYRHKKGGIYVVDEFTIDTDTGEWRVTYHQRDNSSLAYSRRRNEFEDGRFVRLFAL